MTKHLVGSALISTIGAAIAVSLGYGYIVLSGLTLPPHIIIGFVCVVVIALFVKEMIHSCIMYEYIEKNKSTDVTKNDTMQIPIIKTRSGMLF